MKKMIVLESREDYCACTGEPCTGDVHLHIKNICPHEREKCRFFIKREQIPKEEK